MPHTKKKTTKKVIKFKFLENYGYLAFVAGITLVVIGVGLIASQIIWTDTNPFNLYANDRSLGYFSNAVDLSEDQHFQMEVEEGGQIQDAEIAANEQNEKPLNGQVLGVTENNCIQNIIECKPQYAQAKSESTQGVPVAIVDKATQRMVLFVGGEVVENSSVTTGKRGFTTVSGTYKVNRKLRNIYLVAPASFRKRGINYRLKVQYWIGLATQKGRNSGYGFHDAYWRSSFGGNDYTYNGSHGCINTPLDVVSRLYEKIPVGTKVVIF